MSLSTQVDQILGEVNSAKRQIVSFESGTKCAATRARSSLQEAAKMTGVLRKDILAKAKEMVPKTRGGKSREKPAPAVVAEPDEEELPPPPKLKRQTAKEVDIDPMDVTLPTDVEPKKKPRVRRAKK
jgi:hypothetical protein